MSTWASIATMKVRASGWSSAKALSAAFAGREGDGNNDKVPEGSGPEQRPVLPANAPRFNAQELEHPTELGRRRLLRGSHQRVGQGDHAESRSRMRSSRRVGLGISSVARGRSPKAQRPAIKATNSFS